MMRSREAEGRGRSPMCHFSTKIYNFAIYILTVNLGIMQFKSAPGVCAVHWRSNSHIARKIAGKLLSTAQKAVAFSNRGNSW